MSGHTKGPWRIDVNGSERWSVDYDGPSSTFMTICAKGRREPIGFAVEPSAYGNDEEIEANARLIAAAPDGLAFAKAHEAYMLDAGYSGPDDAALHPKAAENWRQCRAFISRATEAQP